MPTNAPLNRKLRMGLIGGGQGIFIGRIHATAAEPYIPVLEKHCVASTTLIGFTGFVGLDVGGTTMVPHREIQQRMLPSRQPTDILGRWRSDPEETVRREIAKKIAIAKFSVYLAQWATSPGPLHIGTSFGGHFVSKAGSIGELFTSLKQLGLLAITPNSPAVFSLVVPFVLHFIPTPESISHDPQNKAGDYTRSIAGNRRTSDRFRYGDRLAIITVAAGTRSLDRASACREFVLSA
jgi:hypothetical protein